MDTLKTERLVLTPFSTEDAEEVYEYAKDPDVGPRAGWKPHDDVAESRHIIETLFIPSGAWAIRLREGEDAGRVIGTIALEKDRHRDETSREMGYSLSKKHWGKGIMTEAAKRVLRYGFEELGLAIIGICTSPVNERSQGVIRNCGFSYEGTIRRAYRIYDGTCRDSLCYSILKEEWEAQDSDQ